MSHPAHADELLDLATCPADRLWRYPISRLLVGPLMGTPVTPKHVTVFHTIMAVIAGGIITVGTPRALFVAGLLFEGRAILDCLDGELARAKKLCSPAGRALDQLGDTIGFASLMIGGFVCLSRAHGPAAAAVLVLATALIAASGSAAWDYFRRSLSSLLTCGYDTTAEEHQALRRSSDARSPAVLQMSRIVDGFQWCVLGPPTAPWQRASAGHSMTPLGRAVQDAAERDDPALRSLLWKVGFVGGDNILMLLTASLLLGRFVEAFPLVIVWGIAIWAYTVSTVNRYLQQGSRPRP